MDDIVYIWDVTIPDKFLHRFYQACILVGLDIYDECQVYCCDHPIMFKASYRGYFADLMVTCTELQLRLILDKLGNYGVYGVDCEFLDILEEEEI